MQDVESVRERYRERLSKIRRDFFRERLAEQPSNCVHNHKHKEDVRLCMLGASDIKNWPGNMCNTVENAKSCPFYSPVHAREDVVNEFESVLSDPNALRELDLELYVLKWVLEDSTPSTWFQRLWSRIQNLVSR